MTSHTTAVADAGPRARMASGRRLMQVVLHLTAREFRIRYSSAFLGWLWTLIPTVARFTVLAVVFSVILPDPGPNYLSELAIGILGWSWFVAGVESATTSAANRQDLLVQPALPRQVVPVISVLTDAFDYLAGVPVVLLVVWFDTGDLPGTGFLFAVLVLLQGCLILGVGMAASVADVRWRDSRRLVALVLSVGIYVTPVFYTGRLVSDDLQWLVTWNPMGLLLEAQREVLVYGRVPDASFWVGITALCGGVLVFGWLLHRRCAATFLDHL